MRSNIEFYSRLEYTIVVIKIKKEKEKEKEK